MTLREITNQICSITTDGAKSFGYTNRKDVYNFLKNSMSRNDLFHKFYINVNMADWNFWGYIQKFSDKQDGYDYVIVDTQEESEQYFGDMMKRYCKKVV